MLTEKKPLGKNGPMIPPVVFGTSALGNLYTELDENTKCRIVKACFENVECPVVFDSAGKYGAGLALEMLGKCLELLNINSDDVIISNKLGWQQVPLTAAEPQFEPGVWKNIKYDATQTISYDGIMKCWEQGNQFLGHKYKPRLVSVHDPDEYLNQASSEAERKKLYRDILDAYKALDFLKKSGLVSGVGIGAKDWRMIELLADDTELDWVMFANSMTIFRHQPELLSFMEKIYSRGVGIINSAVFNAGFLIGGEFFDYRVIRPDSVENRKIFQWREDFFEVCRKYDVRPVTACVHFGLSPPGVSAVSLNTSNPERVKKNTETVVADVPAEFYEEMKKRGLISQDYPYV